MSTLFREPRRPVSVSGATVQRRHLEKHRPQAGTGIATPGLWLLAALAAVMTTIFGSDIVAEAGSTTFQVLGAAVAAAVAVAIVPVAWVVARRSGGLRRLRLAEVVGISALLSIGAAAIHCAVVPDHFREWWGFGAFFIVTGVIQYAWAALALIRPSRGLFWIGAIGNALIVVTWIASRTKGLPFGPEPWTPETIGFADVVATAFEVLLVVGAVALALRWNRAAVGDRRLLPVWLVGLATLALTALALLSAIGAASGVVPPSM